MSADPSIIEDNPFLVLELSPWATPIDIERQKQKLLGMLELGLSKAAQYATPAGHRPRTADLVRRAAEELRDPARRLVWELWSVPQGEESLPVAVSALAEVRQRVEERAPIDAAAFDAVGAAWDDALADDETSELVAERAEALSLDDTDAVFETLGADAERQLVAILEDAPPFDLDPIESELGTRARQRYLDRTVEGLELAAQRLTEVDEPWPAWRAFIRHYSSVADGRGDYARRCAFDAVYTTLADYAAERFNGGTHEPAATIFGWLRDRAGGVGDDQAQEQQRENARIAARAMHAAAVEPTTLRDKRQPSMGWSIIVGMILLVNLGRFCAKQNDTPRYDPPRIHFDTEKMRERMEQIRQDMRRNLQYPPPGGSYGSNSSYPLESPYLPDPGAGSSGP